MLSFRVKGMLMVNVLAVVAGLLMGLCRMWKPHIMVISGRAVMGFYCGEAHMLKCDECMHDFLLIITDLLSGHTAVFTILSS